MKLKLFFSRRNRDSSGNTPINGIAALTGSNEPQAQKKRHNTNLSGNGHSGQMVASAVAPGLLALPKDLHLDALGRFLNPNDWASLAATCKGLNNFYGKKIKSYKTEVIKYVTELVPAAVLSDPLFKDFPINYLRLGKILKKSGPIIKMMTNFNFEPWQIAALLGMEEALDVEWHAAQKRNPNIGEGPYTKRKDDKGYTALHYEVVGGDRTVVQNHIEQLRRPDPLEYYELAEIAAAAGSIDIIDLIRSCGHGVFNMQWMRQKTHQTFADWAFEFDQGETVTWLLGEGVRLNFCARWDKSQILRHRDINAAPILDSAHRDNNL